MSKHSRKVRELYAEWYLMPEDQRPFRTRWCDEHGVHESTCIRWENQDWFQDLLDETRQRLAMTPDDLQSVIRALKEKAESGDPRAIDLYLKYTKEVNGPRVQDQDSSEWSDEELAELLEAELIEVRARIAAATA